MHRRAAFGEVLGWGRAVALGQRQALGEEALSGLPFTCPLEIAAHKLRTRP